MYCAKHHQYGFSRLLIIILSVTAIGLGLFANVWWQQQQLTQNEPVTLANGTYLYDQGSRIPAIELIDENGQAANISSLQEDWYLWFFGFTHCPDVCPMTLSTLTAVTKKIEPQLSSPIKIVFVTVDPERDTPARLQAYLNAFDSDAIGLTGDPSALKELRQKLGIIAVQIDDPNSASGTTFDHSSAVYLSAPDGKIAALFPAPHDVKQLVASIQSIAKQIHH